MWLADKHETKKDGESMRTQKAARDCCNNRRAKTSTISRRDDASITESEYERGTRIAGWMFCAMFFFMTVWTVISSWC